MLASLLLMAATPTAASSLMVGVLTQDPCSERKDRFVQVVFAKAPEGWRALRSWDSAKDLALPREWTVAFDGRRLGQFRTLEPRPSGCPFSCGVVLSPGTGQFLPKVKAPPGVFGMECADVPYRPLVVVSEPHYADPAGWKSVEPAAVDLPLLFQQFKMVAGNATVCPPRATADVPFEYAPTHLRLRSYRDVSGRFLVTARLDPHLDTCGGPNEVAWMPHTFVLGSVVKYLGPEITLIDAGDFDADGRSELLFWHAGHDGDGYVLFDDAFGEGLKVYRGYH
jgi:hypothetical protein